MALNPLFQSTNIRLTNPAQQKPLNFAGGIGIAPTTGIGQQGQQVQNTNPMNQTLLSSALNLGTKAQAPQMNIATPKNTVPPQMAAPKPTQTTPDVSNPNSAFYTQNPNFARPGETATQYAARTGQAQSQTQTQTQPSAQQFNPATSYGQYVSALANAPQNSPEVQKAITGLQDLQNQYATAAAQIGGTPGLGQQEAQGQQGLLSQLFSTKQAAAQTALQNALQEQGLRQQAFGQAAGFAQPQAVPYSSQFVSPITGQPVIGGGATGNLPDAASLYASRVLSGKMTYPEAVSALNAYGPVGQQALTQALGPDFSTIQSNVNSAIQGQLGPAAQNAANQLQNLQETMGASPGLISSGIPVVNSLMRTLSSLSGVGAGSTQALNSALVDARAAMANALGVANNSTPSAYDAYVRELLPDGLTPDQLSNAITQFNNQISGKLQAYGTSGTTQFQAPQSQTSGNYDF